MNRTAAEDGRSLRRAAPFIAGLVGVAGITGLIVLTRAWVGVPNLSVLYVLLVLMLGSRPDGRVPALAASALAFLAYDFFVVPPVGTLAVTGLSGLLELVLLLAAALVTSQLAASLASSRRQAAASASEAQDLYSLATGVLRSQEVSAALGLLAERAARLAAVASFAVVGVAHGSAECLAGTVARPEDLGEARRAVLDGHSLGCRLRGGVLDILPTRPERSDALAILPLTGGALVMRADPAGLGPGDLRLLAGLAALAELLLARRRASSEEERRRVAETSDGLKTAVLSSLSHELKSPLASLRAGLTALAGDTSGLSAQHRELLRDLDSQALRLDRLLEELLTMSRLEAGALPRVEPVAVPEAVGAVLARLEPRLRDRRVELDLPSDVPPALADELQLDGVLTNLVENAVEWSPAGARIAIGARATREGIEVWVGNEGPAIAPEQVPQVFDKFWTRREGGTGLGLAIAKRIVEAHGGTIEARNLRSGPEFRFTLPAARIPEPVP